ncbi:SGNH/GDSL hydrolase family protein [Horticoccus luteus]|uniref:SGNH/GDSL hydrolase family protein n=1 Tax=Horticoccus luteus TaxID=2862869 RepID=A0A8F9TZD4_9BACT|nr:SGNH/GDSL hydrolase family protein [Horticoccus luteus]QYM80674.1 SGNH/GDSL hydrolase family protein [Horticoccus luteus]
MAPSLLFAPRSRLVMIGDSVTDCNRSRPVGEGLFDGIGRGYPMLVDAWLAVAYPELAIRVSNVGTSSHTVRDLQARWQTDVLDLTPDWVSVMIGVNDVWRQFDSPRQPELAVSPEDYAATLDELVELTLPQVRGMILMSPCYVESNATDAMRARMDTYGALVRSIAQRHNVVFVDTQAAFAPLLAHLHSAAISWDRVHPNHIGHAVLARAFLNGVGFDWSRLAASAPSNFTS